MITFTTTASFRKHTTPALWEAINDVTYTLYSLREDIDIMPIVSFDPLYTKPINLTSVDIVSKGLEEHVEVTLDTYTQNWFSYKYAPVIAHVKPHEPTRIYYNTRVLAWKDMTKADWMENLFHEITHLWDLHSPYRFDHGNNNLKGKANTAPEKLSKVLTSLAIGLKMAKQEEMLIW